jgi:hypothetical protein
VGDRAREFAAYEVAAKVADQLLAKGLPLIGFMDVDMGASVAFAFQLDGERAKYAVRCPVSEATVDHVEKLYLAVA